MLLFAEGDADARSVVFSFILAFRKIARSTQVSRALPLRRHRACIFDRISRCSVLVCMRLLVQLNGLARSLPTLVRVRTHVLVIAGNHRVVNRRMPRVNHRLYNAMVLTTAIDHYGASWYLFRYFEAIRHHVLTLMRDMIPILHHFLVGVLSDLAASLPG